MKNFQPGGLRHRRDDIGGRPQGDVKQYAPKNRQGGKGGFTKSFGAPKGKFQGKPRFERNDREQRGFPAVCSSCGRNCDVPFRPDGSKPVFCRDCFASGKTASTNSAAHPERFTANERAGRPAPVTQAAPVAHAGISMETYELLTKQLAAVEGKVSQILALIKASEKVVENLPEVTPVAKKATKKAATKAEPKVKKEAVAKKVAPTAKKTATKSVPKKVAAAKKAPAKKAAPKKK